MEIDEIKYDIDNVDIEQEMEDMDIENEKESEEEEREQIEAAEAEEKWRKQASKVNAKNLAADLLKDEVDRKHYNVKYKGNKCSAIVLHKFNDMEYLFSVKEAKADNWKTVKLKLSDIQ